MKKNFTEISIFVLLMLLGSALFAQNSVVSSITSGGLTRSFRIYVPDIYDGSTEVPLLFNLHGYSSNALEQEFYADFRPVADTANFIIIAPDGTVNGSTGEQFWNAFGLPDVDDVAFISDLIDYAIGNYSIDQSRIYSTGMSNGGFMSYTLACALSERITAIASVTGSMITTQVASCQPSHPVPVMQIHGTADGTVPYAGGLGIYGIEDLVDYWVAFNECDSEPAYELLPDISTTDNCTAEHYVYSNGLNNSSVEFYKIIGGDHTWPGAPINFNGTNYDFNAVKEIWRFFSQYSLEQLTSVDEQKTVAALNIYPNPSSEEFVIDIKGISDGVIQVYNEQGALILNDLYKANTQYKLEPGAAGVYMVRIQSDDVVITKRILKI